MGCCCSSEEDKDEQVERGERERLLTNPISDTSPVYPSLRDGYGAAHDAGDRPSDEQSKLNQILQDTANSVIDVSAIDSPTMEQHEFMDREKQYSTRVAALSASGNLSAKLSRPVIADDSTAVERILASEPLTASEISLITEAATLNAKALESLKVEHKEDLVVSFGVP